MVKFWVLLISAEMETVGLSQSIAVESIKLIAGVGESLGGRLLVLDGLRMQWRELRLRADPACPVCGR